MTTDWFSPGIKNSNTGNWIAFDFYLIHEVVLDNVRADSWDFLELYDRIEMELICLLNDLETENDWLSGGNVFILSSAIPTIIAETSNLLMNMKSYSWKT